MLVELINIQELKGKGKREVVGLCGWRGSTNQLIYLIEDLKERLKDLKKKIIGNPRPSFLSFREFLP